MALVSLQTASSGSHRHGQRDGQHIGQHGQLDDKPILKGPESSK